MFIEFQQPRNHFSGAVYFYKMRTFLLEQFLRLRKVCTDTRKIEKDSIFFALKGGNFNGNAFAAQALESGAALAVVDEDIEVKDSRIIKVDDALTALQNLSGDYRRTLNIPFLAITGSNGKTTTKELIRDVLAKKFRVTATIGNLNNHIGVPLTLLSIPADCEFAVIEMGANHQGEIKSYCQYAAPDYALITNIGKAHLEGFGGPEGVKKGKKELYDFVSANGGKIFVNSELPALREISQGMNQIAYGFDSENFKLRLISESPVISYVFESGAIHKEVQTHLAGAYNLYNIASAIAIGMYFGVDVNKIHDAITEYNPNNNRSQLTRTSRNLVIMDAYNANPTSTEHALISLANQENADTFFILGDMLELGEHGPEEHLRMANKTKELGLKGIFIGPIYEKVLAGTSGSVFKSRDEAEEFLRQNILSDRTILVKGSRGMQLEKLLPLL